jgi:hypothetical protein
MKADTAAHKSRSTIRSAQASDFRAVLSLNLLGIYIDAAGITGKWTSSTSRGTTEHGNVDFAPHTDVQMH